jgi:hypothetical protein
MGIDTVDELLALPCDDFLDVPGLGSVTLREIGRFRDAWAARPSQPAEVA